MLTGPLATITLCWTAQLSLCFLLSLAEFSSSNSPSLIFPNFSLWSRFPLVSVHVHIVWSVLSQGTDVVSFCQKGFIQFICIHALDLVLYIILPIIGYWYKLVFLLESKDTFSCIHRLYLEYKCFFSCFIHEKLKKKSASAIRQNTLISLIYYAVLLLK